jgi:hypothetical protein
VLWTIIGLYALTIILIHVPSVQRMLGREVASAVSHKIGSRVQVGRVDLGFFNRMILDDVLIYDQQGKQMLSIVRMSAKLDIGAFLSNGEINISSAQLFTFHGTFYKNTALADANYQFVLDSLASRDTTKHSALNLRVNSLIIRHGTLTYDRYDLPPTNGKFNVNHLSISNVSADIALKKINADSLNLNVKKLALTESSGLVINRLDFDIDGHNPLPHDGTGTSVRQSSYDSYRSSALRLHDFILRMPDSKISISQANIYFKRDKKGYIIKPSVHFNIIIPSSTISPNDFSALLPKLKNFGGIICLSTRCKGSLNKINLGETSLVSSDGNLRLLVSGFIAGVNSKEPDYSVNISRFRIEPTALNSILRIADVNIGNIAERCGSVAFQGEASGKGKNFTSSGKLSTDAGDASLRISMSRGNILHAQVDTKGIDIGRLTDNAQLGILATTMDVTAQLGNSLYDRTVAKGNISRFGFRGYDFRNITFDASAMKGTAKGNVILNDPNGNVNVSGQLNMKDMMHSFDITTSVRNLNLYAMRLSAKQLQPLDADIHAVSGTDDDMISLRSSIADADIRGSYNMTTIAHSITSMLHRALPTAPIAVVAAPKNVSKAHANDFSLSATLKDATLLNTMTGSNLSISQPIIIDGVVNDRINQLYANLSMPNFNLNNTHYETGNATIFGIGDSISGTMAITRYNNGKPTDISLNASAGNNNLLTTLQWANHEAHRFGGSVTAATSFYHNALGKQAALINIQPSSVIINDTTWHLRPASINYSDNRLDVNHLTIFHDHQHIMINGVASRETNDSLIVDLKDADLEYILDAVNFHSVDFGGQVTGHIRVGNVFTNPKAVAHLTVNDFLFLHGPMGVLRADATWENGQVDIDAVADEKPSGFTTIKGYVSIKQSYIDLMITPHNARLSFLNDIIDSFADNINLHGSGKVNVVGPLSNINMRGEAVGDGSVRIKSLNATYYLRSDTIRLVPDEIQFPHCPIYDSYGNTAYVDGAVHHRHISNFTYDVNVETKNILGYNYQELGDMSFCGTIFAAGDVGIHGRSGRVTIDVEATPNSGSEFTYNAAGPDAIVTNDFITWHDKSSTDVSSPLIVDNGLSVSNPLYVGKESVGADSASQYKYNSTRLIDIPSDIFLNFIIHANPSATLQVIMDQHNGDYIALNGEGDIRATYYNKGAFQMFGTYTVRHGTYKLTIQNMLHKDFTFNDGGTIVFGGDPYDAALNLKATYVVPAVSLSDLSIGNTFSNNNVRVNCMMNITGQPKSPKVDFDLDLPTVNADEAQMVRSIINSEENMNMQVVYLLGIGRFYTQGSSNNAEMTSTQQNQTTRMMQSLLSGALSNQISNALSNIIKNNNWNIGANISTGDEGWNNAEYEGLLSGRLLNNRLLINGQFGYRDNPNRATTSFIGDFDIQYLLHPNGNLSIKGYNHTNDRYFTKSSLNTQGIGLMIKKDFNGLSELFKPLFPSTKTKTAISKPKKKTTKAQSKN